MVAASLEMPGDGDQAGVVPAGDQFSPHSDDLLADLVRGGSRVRLRPAGAGIDRIQPAFSVASQEPMQLTVGDLVLGCRLVMVDRSATIVTHVVNPDTLGPTTSGVCTTTHNGSHPQPLPHVFVCFPGSPTCRTWSAMLSCCPRSQRAW